MGGATEKLHLFGLDEEILCVRSLCLIREDRCGGWLKFIAL